MGDIVNLRMARKRKARAEKDRSAEQNRQAHGRTKAERDAAQAMREREAAAHEGHRLDRDEFGSNRPEFMNAIDSEEIEREDGEG